MSERIGRTSRLKSTLGAPEPDSARSPDSNRKHAALPPINGKQGLKPDPDTILFPQSAVLPIPPLNYTCPGSAAPSADPQDHRKNRHSSLVKVLCAWGAEAALKPASVDLEDLVRGRNGLDGGAVAIGLAATALTMLLPDHMSLYEPVFHVKSLWLLVTGVVILRSGLNVSA